MKSSDTPSADGTDRDRPLSFLPQTLTLSCHFGGEEKTARAMEAWVKGLADEAGGRLVCARAEMEDQPSLPSLSLSTRAGSSVHYHFVPEGPEVPIFRQFLWDSALQVNVEGEDAAQLGEHQARREMLLFVSNHCPNCPHAVRTIQSLAGKLPNLSVHLLEAVLHADLAEKHDIRSVPTLLIDQDLRYVGSLDEEKLFSILGTEDSQPFAQEKIRKQIKEGSALEAAEWIAGGGDPSFLAPDLGKSTFEERIALLLALEEALERAPRCLDPLVDALLPYLETADASVRGDIADLLGKIGDKKALPSLKKLCEDPDPNVAEVATEAVESIEEGS